MIRDFRFVYSLLFAFLCCTLTPAMDRLPSPPPLGRLVDVGGYRVHVYCTGKGSPAVIITGAGYSSDWGLVQPAIASFTQVCTYDHAGIAWSDHLPAGGPVDSCATRVNEVHEALKALHIHGPYVMVGQSLGALVSRYFERTYPQEVAGIVTVDHAFFIVHRSLPPGPPSLFGPPQNAPAPHVIPEGATIGRGHFEKLDRKDYELHQWAASLGGAEIATKSMEIVQACTSEIQAMAGNDPLPMKAQPIIVLRTPRPLITPEEQLLAMSSNSQARVAPESGHYIMIDRPDLVIQAIKDVVNAVRNHTPLETQ
ncbi:alpha/beta fold hydrolase [Terriglobus albidus]|uniref:alpha/beta fold hydrolase n=1 Tax=Terriglobus albidus TaxID=1592106 RepID=UPI0021E0E02B|nr:alpha/beta hydrolase [Terriglobus albidus]